MELLSLVYRQLSLALHRHYPAQPAGAVNRIGVIAFINQSLLQIGRGSAADPGPACRPCLCCCWWSRSDPPGPDHPGSPFRLICVAACSSNCWIPTSPSASNRAGALLASFPATSIESPSPSCLPELVRGLVLTLELHHLPVSLLSPALLGEPPIWVTVTMVVGWLDGPGLSPPGAAARPKIGSTRTTSPSSPGAGRRSTTRACPLRHPAL